MKENKIKLTIHTATYNRAYILEKAYKSLLEQTCKDFEWIITDDGSIDGTDKLVSSWMGYNNGFEIIYNKLDHVGIPRALNSGVQLARTDWFMMLDSDDEIASNTVEFILDKLPEIEQDDSFVGIGFCRCHPDGRYMKNQTPLIDSKIGYVDATNIERKMYNLDMDMMEVTRILLLKKYPFQVWPTEKYAPEQLNYNQIAMAGYKYRWYNEKLYFCDYLPDGQTRDNRIVMNNPMGFAMMYKQNMQLLDSFKEKYYCAMQAIGLSIYAGNVRFIKELPDKLVVILAFPAGVLLFFRRKRQFSLLKKVR